VLLPVAGLAEDADGMKRIILRDSLSTLPHDNCDFLFRTFVLPGEGNAAIDPTAIGVAPELTCRRPCPIIDSLFALRVNRGQPASRRGRRESQAKRSAPANRSRRSVRDE
jgi:hypothetical protein